MARLLYIDQNGEGLDLSWRAQAYGHQVKHFIKDTPKTSHIGRGIVPVVREWEPHAEWADAVIMCDNTLYVQAMDKLREAGITVIGPTQESVRLELDRHHGMGVFKRHGIGVIPYKLFEDYDAAIRHVKRTGERFVSKPDDDKGDKALSYVSKSPADMVYMLERWKRNDKLHGRFILQTFLSGSEMAVGGWLGPHGFNSVWCENFEYKKLMPGDMGPNCYDEQTEVLTGTGWKFWRDITKADKLAAVHGDEIRFEHPSAVYAMDHDGEMIRFRSPYVDLLVTPNHRMHVSLRKHETEFNFVEAREVMNAAQPRKYHLRRAGAKILDFATDNSAYARLLGMHLADGYCKKRSIVFGNCPAHKEVLIKEAARAEGLEAKRYGADVYINSARLCKEWKPLGLACDKYVPKWVKNCGVRTLQALLEGLALDATTRANNLTYCTASKQLANDIQELCVKVGWASQCKFRVRQDAREGFHESHCYEIGVSKQRMLARLNPEYSSKEAYKGKVYCATVSSHVVIVRRNGKICYNGQTGEMGTVLRYVKTSKLANKVLKPLEEYLVSTGHTGYVDVNCIIDDTGVPYPLEFTMRPGWPTANIQAALHDDMAEGLLNLAHGVEDFKTHTDLVAIGACVAIPDFPYSHITRKEVVEMPIYGLKPSLLEHVHPTQMMRAPNLPQNGPTGVFKDELWATAGDYVMVVTATAPTVSGAREILNRRLDQISIPNSPFYRNDVGRSLSSRLPKIQRWGYAKGLNYPASVKS